MSDTILNYPDNHEPVQFTRDELGWLPWLPPIAEDALTERHLAGLVDRGRAKSDYFRLLAHDPEVLGARTRTDKDIFYNPQGGLPRNARELAATAVSRRNGCIFCASVHARFAAHYSKRPEDVDLLLKQGINVSLERQWQQIVQFASALSATPSEITDAGVAQLFSDGYSEAEILDLIYASAFFNWANRLMLSLGEPSVPASGN
jgi:alkylhydroperoxidase domain protein